MNNTTRLRNLPYGTSFTRPRGQRRYTPVPGVTVYGARLKDDIAPYTPREGYVLVRSDTGNYSEMPDGAYVVPELTSEQLVRINCNRQAVEHLRRAAANLGIGQFAEALQQHARVIEANPLADYNEFVVSDAHRRALVALMAEGGDECSH